MYYNYCAFPIIEAFFDARKNRCLVRGSGVNIVSKRIEWYEEIKSLDDALSALPHSSIIILLYKCGEIMKICQNL